MTPIQRLAPVASQPSAPSRAETPRVALVTTWARHADEVRAAQQLRWRIFADEMGARLAPPAGTPAGHDVDVFDAHCEHLLVRTVETDEAPSRVVGTYRVMTPSAARRLGGLYSDTEFDLTRLRPLRNRMVELGRSCTDPAFRHGGVILLLWSSLAEFMTRNGLDLAIGCASVPMADGGHVAASLWRSLSERHLAPIEQRVRPRLPLPVDELRGDLAVEPPPLIKGYLACGAKLLGAPAWDPDFGTADLPMLLDLAELPESYRRRFLAAQGASALTRATRSEAAGPSAAAPSSSGCAPARHTRRRRHRPPRRSRPNARTVGAGACRQCAQPA